MPTNGSLNNTDLFSFMKPIILAGRDKLYSHDWVIPP